MSTTLRLLTFILFAHGLWADHGRSAMRVHFIDVGQGDAIWIQGPPDSSGKRINALIDGGPDSGPGNRLITYLETYKLKKDSIIDYVILTHPHTDHYAGLMDVLANYQVRTIVDSGFSVPGPQFAAFLKAAREEKCEGKSSTVVHLLQDKTVNLALGPEVQASLLYVESGLPALGSGNDRANNASTVLRVVFGEVSFLFTGDAEGRGRHDPAETLKYVEKRLLDEHAGDLHATVLKVGHHGSKTSSTLEFIRKVKPDVVVIMSGRKSFSGTFLPDQEVIDTFKREFPKAIIARTDQDDEAQKLTTMTDADGDDVLVLTDGQSFTVHQARGEKYPRHWVRLTSTNH